MMHCGRCLTIKTYFISANDKCVYFMGCVVVAIFSERQAANM